MSCCRSVNAVYRSRYGYLSKGDCRPGDSVASRSVEGVRPGRREWHKHEHDYRLKALKTLNGCQISMHTRTSSFRRTCCLFVDQIQTWQVARLSRVSLTRFSVTLFFSLGNRFSLATSPDLNKNTKIHWWSEYCCELTAFPRSSRQSCCGPVQSTVCHYLMVAVQVCVLKKIPSLPASTSVFLVSPSRLTSV